MTGSELIVTLVGNYKWRIIWDCDNSTNTEVQKLTWQAKQRISVSTATLHQAVRNTLKDPALNFSKLGGYVLKVEVQGDSVHGIASQYYSTHPIPLVDLEKEESFSREFVVGPKTHLSFYRLIFFSPGLVVESDIIYQLPGVAPAPLADVSIVVQVEKTEESDVISEGKYSIRSRFGTYLTAHPGGEGSLVSYQLEPSAWTVVRAPGGCYGFRSVYGTYLRAHPGGEGAKVDLHHVATQPTTNEQWRTVTWEQFNLVPAENGKFGLRSIHGTYIRARSDSKVDVQIDRRSWGAMTDEQFVLERI